MAFRDLTGKRYGELTVLRRARKLDMGNYEPGNCCWGTPKQQAEEQRKKRLLLRENNLEAV